MGIWFLSCFNRDLRQFPWRCSPGDRSWKRGGHLDWEVEIPPALDALEEVVAFAFRVGVEVKIVRPIFDSRIVLELAWPGPHQPVLPTPPSVPVNLILPSAGLP